MDFEIYRRLEALVARVEAIEDRERDLLWELRRELENLRALDTERSEDELVLKALRTVMTSKS